MGDLDILVNNAGLTRDTLFVRLTDEDWNRVIAVNLTAAFKLSRAVLMGMMRRRHGRIISISSVVGVTGNAGQGNYAASKAGLIGMTKALAQEVASRGVTANCIAPGFVGSAMTDALNEKQKEAILARVPMKRLGTVDRDRRRRRLSRERRGRLYDRPDDSRQWWYGHDMKQENRRGTACTKRGLRRPAAAAGQGLRKCVRTDRDADVRAARSTFCRSAVPAMLHQEFRATFPVPVRRPRPIARGRDGSSGVVKFGQLRF